MRLWAISQRLTIRYLLQLVADCLWRRYLFCLRWGACIQLICPGRGQHVRRKHPTSDTINREGIGLGKSNNSATFACLFSARCRREKRQHKNNL
jgi:hypothetical protein